MNILYVEIAAANVLDLFALIDPVKMTSKLKLHLLVHLKADILHFGPLVGVATKTFSVWRSSLKTGKRPRPDWTKTNQDRKFSGPIKTITMVRSSVYRHSQKLKTRQRPVLVVSTGFSALKSGRSQARIFLFQSPKYYLHALIFDWFST